MKHTLSPLLLATLLCTGLVLTTDTSPALADAGSVRAPDHLVHYQSKVMGTVVNLTIWTDNDIEATKASKAVFDEFDRVNRLMSSWLEDSAVATINRNAGLKAVVVDPEVMKLAVRAQKAAKRSDGAFDISVGAYRGLWKFDQDIDGTIPDAADVKKRTKLVGYKRVRLNPKKQSIKLMRKGMRITLGGVAKGYAVDRAIAILHKQGFVDFILQAGGDLYAAGQKGNRKWRVGIRDPRGKGDASFALMEVSNMTFSTSGDYERTVVKNGVRYHHILDPSTGSPANASRSVTVMAPDALTADIWSTALFVLGHKKGMKIVESDASLEAVFVDENNQVHVSSGLKNKLQVFRPPSAGI